MGLCQILHWFLPFFALIWSNLVNNQWLWISEKNGEKHNQHIPSGCLLLGNSKRFIQNCHQNANFLAFLLAKFGLLWSIYLVPMIKIKFLNTWNQLWLLLVVFSVNLNCYIPLTLVIESAMCTVSRVRVSTTYIYLPNCFKSYIKMY